METLLGTTVPVFLGVTVILFGGAAFIMGQALAHTWRPAWHNVLYGVLLGIADRFIIFALFGGEGLSVLGFLVNTAVLVGIALFAYRATAVRKMVSQYPWLYEPSGLLGYREKHR
jgi:ABC-type uncharacterized transport system permease subunit